jgi:hypothetical protein
MHPISDATAQDLRRYLMPTAAEAVQLLLDNPRLEQDRGSIPLRGLTTQSRAVIIRRGSAQIVDVVANAMLQERRALAVKLRISGNEMMYQAYDARDSEAQFRRGLVVPLSALIGTLGWFSVHGFYLLAIVPFMLVVLAQSSQQESISELFQAVIQGQITSSAASRLRENVDKQELDPLDDYLFIDQLVYEVEFSQRGRA